MNAKQKRLQQEHLDNTIYSGTKEIVFSHNLESK